MIRPTNDGLENPTKLTRKYLPWHQPMLDPRNLDNWRTNKSSISLKRWNLVSMKVLRTFYNLNTRLYMFRFCIQFPYCAFFIRVQMQQCRGFHYCNGWRCMLIHNNACCYPTDRTCDLTKWINLLFETLIVRFRRNCTGTQQVMLQNRSFVPEVGIGDRDK